MPNLDGGHYFLTVLAPIRSDSASDPKTGAPRSHRHLLAQALATLPTGHQTSSSPGDAVASPFSRNTLNHLARFVIVDGPAYNGRSSGDTIASAIFRRDPLKAQPVDRLNASFLLFAADLDAQRTGEAGLRAYTDALWASMPAELTDVFGHCVGFEEKATDAASFHDYLKLCQVETTMPFNDYWKDGLQATGATRPLVGVAAVAAASVAAAIFLVAAGYVASSVAVAIECVALLLAAATAIGLILTYGAKPFATAPDSDLPSVLKALYLQQSFTHFAIDSQLLDDAALHARFKDFLDATVPDAVGSPTQRPGSVHALQSPMTS